MEGGGGSGGGGVGVAVAWAARGELAAAIEAAIEEANTVATAVGPARDLTNTPSVRKSPQWLADAASRVAAEQGLAGRIWTDQELASSGVGGLTAGGAGSDRPPRVIRPR